MAATDSEMQEKLERVKAAMASGHVRLDVVRLLHFGPAVDVPALGVKVWESGQTKGGNHKWVEIVLLVPNQGETIADTLGWLAGLAVAGG